MTTRTRIALLAAGIAIAYVAFIALQPADTKKDKATSTQTSRHVSTPVQVNVKCATPVAAAVALGGCPLRPRDARPHGLVARAALPIPTWLFGWAAAIVLGVSFAVLGALWRKPRLEEPSERRLFRIPRVVDAVCGALGIAYFALVVYAGFAGSDVPTANIAPTSIYVIFWVGNVVLSVLFGDVFRAFSPWRSV